MGNGWSDYGLAGAVERAAGVLGQAQITGRYHKPPKKLEDDYEINCQELGTGYNGSVYLCTSRRTGEKFAVKGFPLYGMDNHKMVELESEAEIFLELDHPHVARLVDAYQSRSHLHLIMEYMSGGELFYRVEKRKRFTEGDAAEAFYQMLLAVHYLHSHDIVHRDLKLENFLYESETSDHLKLIDFGFSQVWDPNTKLAAAKGTLAYMAPEVLKRSYGSTCDMWSLGVILFILLVGYMPFTGSEAKQRRDIQAGAYKWNAQKWKDVSQEAQELVRAMLVPVPERRPTAAQLLEHPWVTGKSSNRASQVDAATVSALCNFGTCSRFRRTCFGMMAWSLTAQERAAVRNQFLAIDKDKNGTISLQELKIVLQSQRSLGDNDIQTIFQGVDSGGNHEIHYSEFLAAMVENRLALHDDLIRAGFQRFDTDNSGYISYENLKDVLGKSFSDRDVKLIVYHADANHDGKISYNEFYGYLKGNISPEAAGALTDEANYTGRTKTVKVDVKSMAITVSTPDDGGDYEFDSDEDSCDSDEDDSFLQRCLDPCKCRH